MLGKLDSLKGHQEAFASSAAAKNELRDMRSRLELFFIHPVQIRQPVLVFFLSSVRFCLEAK